jgi:hypothetical protein
MSETPDSTTPPPVPQSGGLPPAYGGPSAYPVVPTNVVDPAPLMLSGGLLILAFVAHLVAYLSPEFSIAAGLVEMLSLVAAYIGFLRAGFPSRSGAARGLAVVLIVLYLLSGSGASAIALGALPIDSFAVIILFGLGVLIAGVAFGIVSLVTTELPSPLKSAPIIMYGLVFVLGLITPAISGGGYLVAGLMYLSLASSVRTR